MIQPTTKTTTSTATSMDDTGGPWQLRWKRPQWSRCSSSSSSVVNSTTQPVTTTNYTTSTAAGVVPGVTTTTTSAPKTAAVAAAKKSIYVIGQASATILESEWKIVNNHNHNNNHSTTNTSTTPKTTSTTTTTKGLAKGMEQLSSSSSSLLLTVSIVKSGGNRSSMGGVVADTVIVEIIRQTTTTSKKDDDDDAVTTNTTTTNTVSPSFECIHEKTLHWPNVDMRNRDTTNKDGHNQRIAKATTVSTAATTTTSNSRTTTTSSDENVAVVVDTVGPCSANHPVLKLFRTILGVVANMNPLTTTTTFQPLNHNDNDDDDTGNHHHNRTTTINNNNNNNSSSISNDHHHHQHPTTSTGIVAITLIRVPRKQPLISTSDRTTTPRVVVNNTNMSPPDALDVINLLSLQSNNGSNKNNNNSHSIAEPSLDDDNETMLTTTFATATNHHWPSETIVESENNNDTNTATDLLLVCLRNDGKVHCYSPWKLLNTTSSGNDNWNDNDNGMASLWFGANIFNTVQEMIAPLSQPLSTVELSIPSLQQRPPTEMTTTTNGGPWTDHVRQQQHPSLLFSMFDPSMWDSTLDPTTLHHQTIQNIPTQCYTAHEYICIVGRGYRRWHSSRSDSNNDDGDGDGGSGRVPAATSQNEKNTNNSDDLFGGFVTFITANTMSEKRTLFLPFVPAHVSPFYWDTMKLLLVTGQGHAIAIRLDACSTVVPAATMSTAAMQLQSDETALKKSNKQPPATATIQRFQIIPIDCRNVSNSVHHPTIIGCDTQTSPPAMVMIFSNSDDSNNSSDGIYVVRQTFASFERKKQSSHYQSRPDMDTTATVVITTKQGHVPMTWIPLVNVRHNNVWCRLGQGWCIVGAGKQNFFICYEGSNKAIGPVVRELPMLDVDDEDMLLHNTVLPTTGSSVNLHVQCMESFDVPKGNQEIRANTATSVEVIDEIIFEAMESISALSHRETVGSYSPTSASRRNRQLSLTTQEKSERLLRHCSSWTKLDQSLQSQSTLEYQAPTVTLRTQRNILSILTLRSTVIEHGPAAPFQEVLAWLSFQNDYFTAASIALSLLEDVESLRHLWWNCNSLDHNSELSMIDGLLDGISPISPDMKEVTLTRLADMTVACLTKGGYAMSSTLEQFLSRNTRYDSSRASLMLVASVTGALSEDESHVSMVMGKGYFPDNKHLDCTLWPVRCILKIGVARDRLGTVLLLLNTTIPDELRRRSRFGDRTITQSSLDLCRSLVTLIAETSSESTEVLLDLVDERSRLRFWDSLDHETRKELSVLTISGLYPLLRDQEVRSWLLSELQKCVESEDLASAANIYDKTPNVWLRTIAYGCLKNAGCTIELMLHPEFGEAKEEVIGRCGFDRYRAEVQGTRIAAKPAMNSGGLDFDMIIPALLVLDHRNEVWNVEAETSTRTILNAVCYQAGRGGTLDEPLFVMNSTVLMRQCFRLGDVDAGANLVGGKNGLTLLVSHVLVGELRISMDAAERYVLGESIILHEGHAPISSGPFLVQDCHRKLLFLLDEHVLKIRTYREFTASRGTVDPIYASTLIFRSWWALTRGTLSDATQWLTDWLRQQLKLPSTDKMAISPHRLVCAALIHSLIWSPPPLQQQGDDTSTFLAVEGVNDITTTPLANRLEMDGIFLLQMAQSCCGMVEALPSYVVEPSSQHSSTKLDSILLLKSSLTTPHAKQLVPPNSDTSTINRSEGYNNDDSFVSAVGTYRDMDISQATWQT